MIGRVKELGGRFLKNALTPKGYMSLAAFAAIVAAAFAMSEVNVLPTLHDEISVPKI
jgi:hypothetical protein